MKTNKDFETHHDYFTAMRELISEIKENIYFLNQAKIEFYKPSIYLVIEEVENSLTSYEDEAKRIGDKKMKELWPHFKKQNQVLYDYLEKMNLDLFNKLNKIALK